MRGQTITSLPNAESVAEQADDAVLARAFEDHVRDAEFPCVGAKSALARGTLQTVVCHDLTSGWDDLRIHRELLNWSSDYADELKDAEEFAETSGRPMTPPQFRSLAFIFRNAPAMQEAEFEKHLWTRLQSLADKDVWLEQDYDDTVSPDPDDPHFGLSFGGQAYFVVGMHAAASRPARRFQRPVLVFNLHDQFEQLRTMGRYERLRSAILDRDVALAGDVNPMLARHGERSEAAQYSGRKVGGEWQCPFSDKRADT
ncbi:hypothetical protein HME9302_02066 [Alteripontixanthobacter maritimus]|uniref:YqcI/YcgG family protein n=1 Tax=Alteripontixanthobacter maritimus TaxID=2161824 RepID=A0A369Q925_9SPHN|nr:guanitoxin biosynthesis heme-dependent pre-guanitoxin N-hydroxylase GntA [Alteripontixanthobacter maritimus]RDC60850.1 hypothetical protein HME9302_02066 [Alteripontixanthobacter maritimus]